MNIDPSDEEITNALEQFRQDLAASGRGELDDGRVVAALRYIIEMHRDRGSALMQLLEKPSAQFRMQPVEDDPEKVEVRLGITNRAGEERTVHVATLLLAELVRGGQG